MHKCEFWCHKVLLAAAQHHKKLEKCIIWAKPRTNVLSNTEPEKPHLTDPD